MHQRVLELIINKLYTVVLLVAELLHDVVGKRGDSIKRHSVEQLVIRAHHIVETLAEEIAATLANSNHGQTGWLLGRGNRTVVVDPCLGLLDDIAVERTAQPLVGSHHHQQHILELTHFVVGGLYAVTCIDIRGNLAQLVGIGPHAHYGVLRTAELRRRNHLHGRSDLLRGTDRGDTGSDFF